MEPEVTFSDNQKSCWKSKLRQYLGALLACQFGLCGGIIKGWTSPMQPLLTSDNPPVGSEPMDFETFAWLGAINNIGSIVGTFFWGRAVDHFGRKTTVCYVAVPIILSWILVLVAQNLYWLLLARFIGGIANNGLVSSVPFFISEIAQDDLRGRLGTFSFLSVNAGILISYTVGAYLHYYGLAIFGLIFSIIALTMFIWLPETPLFLWTKGKKEKSVKSISWYRGGNSAQCEITLSEYKDIPKANTEAPSLKSLFSTKGRTKALMICAALWTAKQGNGISPIISFAVSIFQMSGTSITPYQAAIIMASMQLVSGVFCSVTIDHLGRRILLIGSLLVISLSLALLGIFLFVFTKAPDDTLLGLVPLVLLCFHVTSYSLGVGPLTTSITAEILPTEIRGYAMSKLQLLFKILSFTMVKFYPTLIHYLNLYGVFWFYSVISFFFCILFCLYLPETKGKSITEILEELNS